MGGKIEVSMIDNFIDGGAVPNYFEKLKIIRNIKILDDFMGHMEPGKYKITISVEKLEG